MIQKLHWKLLLCLFLGFGTSISWSQVTKRDAPFGTGLPAQ